MRTWWYSFALYCSQVFATFKRISQKRWLSGFKIIISTTGLTSCSPCFYAFAFDLISFMDSDMLPPAIFLSSQTFVICQTSQTLNVISKEIWLANCIEQSCWRVQFWVFCRNCRYSISSPLDEEYHEIWATSAKLFASETGKSWKKMSCEPNPSI